MNQHKQRVSDKKKLCTSLAALLDSLNRAPYF